ncbi:MAG: Xaa-Pro peptidase family protein [Planctomycetaceae bacterium]|jgi:Xaa-Pro aminopeptidase|nr:Xaa-Pro peptidase family protein [Planctomycetaceae bacterium]
MKKTDLDNYTQATLKFPKPVTQTQQREAVVQGRSLPPILVSVYQVRRDKIISLLSKCYLDVLFVMSPVNIRYLTGFTGGDAYLLLRKSGATLISDPRYTIQIDEECNNIDVHICGLGDLPDALRLIIGGKKRIKFGVESDAITLLEHNTLVKAFPEFEFVPTTGIVLGLRQIKERVEIDAIRCAIDVAYKAFADIRKKISTTISKKSTAHTAIIETEIRDDLEYQMRKHGASEKSFASIVCSGKRAAMAHGVPANYDITKEQLLLIDWGAIVDGYMSDLTRVLIVKPQNKKLKQIYNIVLKAQTEAIKAIKPNKKCVEIDAIARNIISDSGYGKNFGHGLGHAVGLEIHESPRFSVNDSTVLKAGMVMTVEPGIYIEGWGGIRIEDDILVTKNGCEVLSSHVPKNFDECIL